MKSHGASPDKAMSVNVPRTSAKNLANSGSVTKAHPGGSRAGGMIPASWQKNASHTKPRSNQSRSGWPKNDGWVGSDW